MDFGIADIVSDSFDVCIDIALDMPKIMILGDDSIFIENYLALCEYKENCIRLMTRIGLLELFGSELKIERMQENNIIIKGRIFKLLLGDRDGR